MPVRPGTASPVPLARFALPILFAGAMAIAFAPIFVRLSEVPPTATAFLRAFLALPLLWIWMLADRRGRAKTGNRDGLVSRPQGLRDMMLLSLPGLLFAGDLAFWHWSIAYTSVANSTLLANFAPVFVTLGAWMLFRIAATRTFLIGMLIALAGAVILMAENLTVGSGHEILGDVLGLITAVWYGAYLLAVNRLRARFPTATMMAWGTVWTALALLVIVLISGEPLIPTTLYGWLVVLGLACVSHVGGQSMIAFSLAHLPASFGSVSLLVQPVAAALLAWLLLSEPLAWTQALGGAIVLGGIFLARRGSRMPPPATPIQTGSTDRTAP